MLMCVVCVWCVLMCVECGTILMWCEAVTSHDAVNICFMFFDGPLQTAFNHVITILEFSRFYILMSLEFR